MGIDAERHRVERLTSGAALAESIAAVVEARLGLVPRLRQRSFNRALGPRRSLTLLHVPLAAVKAAGHAAGGTVNDVVLAAGMERSFAHLCGTGPPADTSPLQQAHLEPLWRRWDRVRAEKGSTVYTQQQQTQSQERPQSSPGQPVTPTGGGAKKGRAGLVVVVVVAIVVVAAVAAFLLMRSKSDDTAATTAAPSTTAAPASTAAPAATAAPTTLAPSSEVAAESVSSDTITVDDVYVDADGQVVVEGSTVTGSVGDVSVDVVNNSGTVTTIPVAIADIGGGKFHMNVDWSQVDVAAIFGGGAGIGRGRGAVALEGTHLELGSKANPQDNKAKITFVAARPAGGGQPGAGAGSPVTTGGAPTVSRPGGR